MFESLFERLVSALDRAGIPYMIIGGQAVLVHGEPRLTRDIDVTLAVDTDRLSEVVGAMTGIGLQPLVDPETFTRKTMVLPCADASSGIRIDLIFSYSPYERRAVERALSIRVGRCDVRFASAEDLVVHKLLAGRPRDIEDVIGILRKNASIDLVYVRSVLDEFAMANGGPLMDRLEAALQRR